MDELPCKTVHRCIGTKPSWQVFTDTLLIAQELSFPHLMKSRRRGTKLAWLTKDLLVRLRERKKCTGSGSKNTWPGKNT